MRKLLMAAVALSFCGSALAQQSAPAFQNNQSEAQRKAGGNQANAELFYMIERLQHEVRKLQGELEEQRYKLDRLSEQSRERYIDLDQRVLDVRKQLDEQPADTGSASPAGRGSDNAQGQQQKRESRAYRVPTQEEQQAYQAIQKLIHEDKNYDAAIDGLYEFIAKYPEGDLTVNAYYWLGEVYLVKPQLEQAKQAFSIVESRFPDHRKASDAAYKLGIAQDRLGEKDKAREQMRSVIAEYPGTKAAELAQSYLK
ncbi:tol-pal system protein YbgF [Marinobacter salicampi]|uniref:tol-pal system protein YbgF n=1 Tax=Marinobacter salicampi TaxID=435907 RepID=UPI00140BD78F|nr:tol-pal system protein YbgF [Marinobacter salicampi]